MAATKLECRDCGREFATSREFGDHFIRENNQIVGCKPEVGPSLPPEKVI